MKPRSAVAMITTLVLLIAAHGGEVMAMGSVPIVSGPDRYAGMAYVGNPGTVTYTNGCS